jgi:hypothetical protein
MKSNFSFQSHLYLCGFFDIIRFFAWLVSYIVNRRVRPLIEFQVEISQSVIEMKSMLELLTSMRIIKSAAVLYSVLRKETILASFFRE